MKYFLTLVLAVLAISCQNNDRQSNQSEINFDWLVGQWVRLNNANGEMTLEKWSSHDNNTWTGTGSTYRGSEKVFQEEIEIAQIDDTWQFVVTGVNEDPTPFNMIKIEKEAFTAENPENEFPKTIRYQLNEGRLEAIISDDSTQIVFQFKAMK